MLDFSHIFVGNDDILQFYQSTHSVIAKIDSYDTLRVDLRSFPPIRVTTKPKIWILKRNLYIKASWQLDLLGNLINRVNMELDKRHSKQTRIS